MTRQILDDRCRTRDLFCPTSDPKAPIPFSAYLEKQNRENPDRTFSYSPAIPGRAISETGPRSDLGGSPLPAAGKDCSATGGRPAVDRSAAAAARLGEVFGSPPVSTERPRAQPPIHYELHRPLPSGMTIDVFA